MGVFAWQVFIIDYACYNSLGEGLNTGVWFLLLSKTEKGIMKVEGNEHDKPDKLF